MDTNLWPLVATSIKPVIANPFGVTKCDEFSDEQIYRLWIEPGGISAIHLLQPTRLMPMYVVGGKGSGKTHLLRYFSRPVQNMLRSAEPECTPEAEFIGIYLKCDSLNGYRFSGKGRTDEAWNAIFQYFFDLWLAQLLISNAPLMPDSVAQEVAHGVLQLFDDIPSDIPKSLAGVLETLQRLQREIDIAISNLPLTGKLEARIKVAPSRLVFGIPEILQKATAHLHRTVFLYLLDEFENLTEPQQKYVNTLVRNRKGTCSFRIGSRLYGITTRDTLLGEKNRKGSEFDELQLDLHWLRRKRKYVDFCERLCIRRLQASGQFPPGEHDELRRKLRQAFREPVPAEFYQKYTLKLLAKYDSAGRLRPYLDRARRQLWQYGPNDARLGIRTSAEVDDIIRRLRRDEYPLLEKVNIFLLYKAWAGRRDLKKSSQLISDQCDAFLRSSGHRPGPYFSNYQHFSGDMLAQLTKEAGFRVRYVGLDTFIRMSSGLPRNLLNILRNTVDWALFGGEEPFAGPPISEETQEQAVNESCLWFFEEARPKRNAAHVQRALERLAELFRAVRYSDKPSECALSTFSFPLSIADEKSNLTLRLAEDWSMLIRLPRGQKDRNTRRVDEKYQLSPMLAPRWELPISRRGALALTLEEVKAVFGVAEDEEFLRVKNLRLRRMNAPFEDGDQDSNQTQLTL